MNSEKIKRVIDACYQVKRIHDLLPPLPDRVSSSFIHYPDVIASLEQLGNVRFSDVSKALNLPRPGVTRTVKDLEAKGYLRKIASQTDGRVTYIAITEKGAALQEFLTQISFLALCAFVNRLGLEASSGYGVACHRDGRRRHPVCRILPAFKAIPHK